MITNMNKEDILLLTDKGLAVFKHYIPFPFKLGRNFLNPLYKDSKASCNVYFDRRSGMYKMKDFGNDDYSGDCFALVGKFAAGQKSYFGVCMASPAAWILASALLIVMYYYVIHQNEKRFAKYADEE